MTDNQQRARDLLTAPHPGTDINPYWRVDMLTAALDAAEARGRAEVMARIERVEALVGDFVHLSRTLHSVVQAEAYGYAAEDLRRALAGLQ